MNWDTYWFYFEKMASPYLLTATLSFLVLYTLLRNKLILRKIQEAFPTKADYIRELGYSLSTLAIFSAIMLLLVEDPTIRSYTTFYANIDDYGWLYFFLAFPLMFLIHYAYFYGMHRLTHTKKLFRFFHYTHRPYIPLPGMTYSLHPLEVLIAGGVPVVFLFLLPMHPLHLSFFYIFSVLYNTIWHLGYELLVHRFSSTWLGRWHNTSTHHNYHHKYFQGNYGFHLLFWDCLMGTFRRI